MITLIQTLYSFIHSNDILLHNYILVSIWFDVL